MKKKASLQKILSLLYFDTNFTDFDRSQRDLSIAVKFSGFGLLLKPQNIIKVLFKLGEGG